MALFILFITSSQIQLQGDKHTTTQQKKQEPPPKSEITFVDEDEDTNACK